MARWISPTDTAKLVRQALSEAFPKFKFSVRTQKYAGGASIDVSWTDGPRKSDVESILDHFSGADFDGMTDSKLRVTRYLHGEPVRFGADYVFAVRRVTPEFMSQCVAKARHLQATDPQAFQQALSAYSRLFSKMDTESVFEEWAIAEVFTDYPAKASPLHWLIAMGGHEVS